MELYPRLSQTNASREVVNTPKITKRNFNPEGCDRMHVKYVVQLLSYSVACSLEHGIVKDELPEDPYRLVVFLKAADKLFDILNPSSLSSQDGKPWKTALRRD